MIVMNVGQNPATVQRRASATVRAVATENPVMFADIPAANTEISAVVADIS